jgi:hypothetical protein
MDMFNSVYERTPKAAEILLLPIPNHCKTCMYTLWTMKYINTPNFSCGCFRRATTAIKNEVKCPHKIPIH